MPKAWTTLNSQCSAPVLDLLLRKPPHPASPPKNQATRGGQVHPSASLSVKQTWTLLNVTVSSHVTSGMQKASRAALFNGNAPIWSVSVQIAFSTSLSLHVMPLLQTQPAADRTPLENFSTDNMEDPGYVLSLYNLRAAPRGTITMAANRAWLDSLSTQDRRERFKGSMVILLRVTPFLLSLSLSQMDASSHASLPIHPSSCFPPFPVSEQWAKTSNVLY